MSPKDRVRANIYKGLLEEEKNRNRRYQKISLSLFLVGILGTSSYYNFLKGNVISELGGNHIVILNNSPAERERLDKIKFDDFFNRKLFEDEQRIDIDTSHVFGFDFQS